MAEIKKLVSNLNSEIRAQRNIMILEQFLAGKTIERIHDSYDEDDKWLVVPKDHVDWNFSEYEYRIKPEPAYRPWTFEEIPVGTIVKSKSKSTVSMIVRKELGFPGKQKDMITVGDTKHSKDTLFVHYTMMDGSPCGCKV